MQKMCSNKRKSTCSSGIDDFTAKYYSVNRNLYQIEEGETFGDNDDEPEPLSQFDEQDVLNLELLRRSSGV